MVSYQLAPEQQDLRVSVARFAREVVAPVIGGYYERAEFPYDIVAKMGKLGLFGLPFPEEYGGMGGDYFALCLALEELARVDSSVAITPGGRGVARRDAHLPVRHRRTARAVAARTVHGGAAGCLRPDRARRRIRHPRRHAHHRQAGGGPEKG